MVLSKREKYIGIGVLAVVGIFALDRIVYTPLTDRKVELDAKILSARQERTRINDLFTTRDRAKLRWNEMSGKSLRADASAAESEILNNVREWAQDSGMSLPIVTPERSKDKEFEKITVRATGTGGIAQIGRFLYRVQTAKVPVRVTNLTINSRKEGTDDLSVQMGIATIYLPPDTSDSKSGARPSAGAGGEASR
jgi:hypothetical protein